MLAQFSKDSDFRAAHDEYEARLAREVMEAALTARPIRANPTSGVEVAIGVDVDQDWEDDFDDDGVEVIYVRD